MTISEAISELENHSAVASAGAGPTDIGKIPCFQVVLDSANYLNDKTGSELENIVYEKTKDLFSTNGDIVVQYSGEYMEDTNDPVFWIFVYQNLGRISVVG